TRIDTPLQIDGQTQNSITYYDGPGVALFRQNPLAILTSGAISWSLLLQVYVSSGTQEAECPPVVWGVYLEFTAPSTRTQQPGAEGGSYVITQPIGFPL